MNDKIVQLFPKAADDRWSWSDETLAAVRTFGIERGYAPNFVERQIARIYDIHRELFGYGGTTWSTDLEIPETLQPHVTELQALLHQACESAQSHAYTRAFNAVFPAILDLAFPEQSDA
jgi:hypothetical protein